MVMILLAMKFLAMVHSLQAPHAIRSTALFAAAIEARTRSHQETAVDSLHHEARRLEDNSLEELVDKSVEARVTLAWLSSLLRRAKAEDSAGRQSIVVLLLRPEHNRQEQPRFLQAPRQAARNELHRIAGPIVGTPLELELVRFSEAELAVRSHVKAELQKYEAYFEWRSSSYISEIATTLSRSNPEDTGLRGKLETAVGALSRREIRSLREEIVRARKQSSYVVLPRLRSGAWSESNTRMRVEQHARIRKGTERSARLSGKRRYHKDVRRK